MANKLSLDPQQLKGGWYYEEGRGLNVYIEVAGSNPVSLYIPWSKIRTSLKRKDG